MKCYFFLSFNRAHFSEKGALIVWDGGRLMSIYVNFVQNLIRRPGKVYGNEFEDRGSEARVLGSQPRDQGSQAMVSRFAVF